MNSRTFRTIQTEVKNILHLAFPLSAGFLAYSATGFFDTIMMGHLGRDVLAAGGLAALTFQVIVGITNGMVMGVSPLVAEAQGSGNRQKVEQVVWQGLLLSLLMVFPLILGVAFVGIALQTMGLPPRTVELFTIYIDIMRFALPATLGFAVLRGFLVGIAHPQPIMTIVIAGTLLNIAGNYVLGFGALGFPQLGLAGLAWSSLVSSWFMFAVLLGYCLSHQQIKSYRILAMQRIWHKPILKKLLGLGVPIAIAFAFEYGGSTAITLLIGLFGETMLAAHQIVSQTVSIIFMIPLGISGAATARVGQWLGQGNVSAIKRTGNLSIAIATIIMFLITLVLMLFPQSIVGLYIDVRNPDNADLLNIAVPILGVVALGVIADGIQKTALGNLHGLQDTKIPMVLGILSYWGIGLTSSYILGFVLGMQGMGLWIGYYVGLTLASVMFIWRFCHLLSKRMKHKYQSIL
ncbi:MATE family efflux transporter [Alkalinema pantanalense CENA528]|uniref:MATE family efflux transporter n=1 Tax=Alkalinema pantanalense TaxID=1620705 RepID=UPI003D6DEDEA